VKQVVGHKQQGMTMGVYFAGFTVEAMRRVVESVRLRTEPPRDRAKADVLEEADPKQGGPK
jgi:hypothetical protein